MFFVGSIGEDRGYFQGVRAVLLQKVKLLVVALGRLYRADGQHGIEPLVAPYTSVGLQAEVLQDILGHLLYALGVHHQLLVLGTAELFLVLFVL